MHTQIISGIKAGQSVVTEIVVDASEDEEDSQPQSQGLISGPGPRGKKK